MEDGCSKRFDIETVDFRPQTYSNGDAMRSAAARGADQSKYPTYSSSAHYSPPPGSVTSQGTLDLPPISAQEYLSGDNTQDAVWNS